MNKKKIVTIVCILFICLGFFVMFGTNLFVTKSDYETMPEANAISSEIARNTTISQTFECDLDSIDELAIVFTKLSDPQVDEEGNIASITIELVCEGQTILFDEFEVDEIEDQHRTFVKAGSAVSGLKGKNVTLNVINNSSLNTGLALMIQDNEIKTFKYNQMNVTGTICFYISGK